MYTEKLLGGEKRRGHHPIIYEANVILYTSGLESILEKRHACWGES